MRGRIVVAWSFALMVLISALALSAIPKPPTKPDSIKEIAFMRPETRVTNTNLPLSEVLSLLPNAPQWEQFLQGQDPGTAVHIDPRSGVASGIQMREPLIPGNGMGNRLGVEDVARTLGREVAEVTPEVVGDLMKGFLARNAGAFGIAVDQIGPVRAVKLNDEFWNISVPQLVRGVPVRNARVVATLGHGNLVLVGAEMWGNVRIDTHPRIDAAEALKAGFDRVGGRGEEDAVWKEPALEILPVAAPGREAPYERGRRPGDGYDHWLLWSFGFKRGDEPENWEVLVDAHSGEVVALLDRNHDATRSIIGRGVYPMTNTGICPSPDRCGTPQSAPMSFADYLTGVYSNSAGIFDYIGTATTTLRSPYIAITDDCGTISRSSDANIDMGTGATICIGSTGNTRAAQTASYELSKLAEMARGWLPNNAWLQGQSGPLNVRTNATYGFTPDGYLCSARYDPVADKIITGRAGKVIISQSCCSTPSCTSCGVCGSENCCPQCAIECRNPGEIATILDHEWGHALDEHDGSLEYDDPFEFPTMSTSAEAYGDITAVYRTQASCLGYGLWTTWPTNNEGCGISLDGTSYNGNMAQIGPSHCLDDCRVRDTDYMKHADNTPDTPQNFVCVSCETTPSRPGPCGLEQHCEAAPSAQAAWDLAARDLQRPPFNYSKTKAFNIASRLHFLGSSNVQIWHSCNCASGTSDGCAAGSGYKEWLAKDDDNGNPLDGTPHMSAIFDAFNRHHIACNEPIVQNSGCVGAPLNAPILTATPGPNQIALSWNADPTASKYFVYRTEGQAGCDMGRARIGTPVTNSFTDTEVADDRFYYYTVEAVGNADTCSGLTSACVCATNPPPAITEICNGVDENCNGATDEGFPDSDGDSRADCADNCPNNYNPTQLDTDNDGTGDVCDTCTDSDGDGYGDPGHTPPNTCPDDCEPSNPEIHPGAPEEPAYPETCYDGVDNDCDGGADVDCGIPPTSHLPSSPPEGMNPGGSLANLGGNPDGNAYFSLNESGTSGAKRLTRIFQFNNMPTDVPMKLYVEGYRNSTSADNFNIRYRTVSGGTCPVDTGTPGWTSAAAVTITNAMPDTGTLKSAVLPASSNSIWCVRVQDSIRSSDSVANWVNLDTLVLKPHGMTP